MSYESIAELVHNLVKDPKSILKLENRLPSGEFDIKELTIVQNVFSKYEVSGDALAIEALPLDLWG
ncbi:hypothetical protein E4K67_27610 [Desulfosporosinus fructosivorans]|uniref:Uncharacterized protein n=1 Tax=Desulfosporosinus fructosivorans TaxID=2018669 RepID=A0A4Z0QX53_9FIRM|nr:hypothetical protein [Desulfosporosinus fructosivorans]TGE35000.1 hypothetical protein E4K67_27610 [Desulfosporosinus fructosivorans]